MSQDKPVNINPTIWKLPLLTSVLYFALMGGIFAVSPAKSQNTARQYLAQAETDEAKTPTATDTEATTSEESVEEETVAATEQDNILEKAIISELNRVRTDPQGYADWLESQKQYYQGMMLQLPGEQPIRTNRGLRSLEEAITFLRQQDELPALSPSTELTSTAQQQITAITNNRKVNNRNNLVYGKVTPEAIVMQLVVDDGFPDRRHRLAIFSQSLQDTGIVCSEIPIYNNVCAIALNTEDNTEIAQTPATEPEATVDNNNQLPKPPDISTPIASESAATVTTETANNNPITPATESATQPESEVATNTATDGNNSTTPTVESEVEPNTATNGNNSITPTVESEVEPNTATNGNNSTTPTVESEVEPNTATDSNNSITPTVESEVATNTATDSNNSITPTVESEVATNTATDSNNSTTPTVESEVEPNPEILSETNPSTAESTTNSEIATTSETTEMVEQGILEEGDDIIPNDGSLYDSYPLEGSAGDSFIITLESQDFDTFLAIMDQDGNIVEQNDDLNEEDSNSRLEITLPDNGTYSVIVNSYDRGGKGSYTLKVSR